MSCAIPSGTFPPWTGKTSADVSRIALALGQIEEAMGALDDNDRQGACEALVRARQFLLQAAESAAARVPLALLTPISDEEVGP